MDTQTKTLEQFRQFFDVTARHPCYSQLPRRLQLGILQLT